MNYTNYLVCLAVIMAGCKALPEAGYSSLEKRSDARPIEQISPIPQNTIPLGSLQKQALTMEDPALSYVDTITNKRIVSLYKAYRVDIREPGTYTIMVQSFGASSSQMFPNRVIWFFFDPLLEVRDSKNAAQHAELVSNSFITYADSTFLSAYGAMSFQTVYRLSKTWRLEVNEPSVLSILVYADNSNLDRVFDKGRISTDVINVRVEDVDVIGNSVPYTFSPSTDGKFLLKVARTTH